MALKEVKAVVCATAAATCALRRGAGGCTENEWP